MLPEIISNSLASLQAGHGRYTVSAFMEFDPSGVRTSRSFARSVIRVDHRFTYEQAFAILQDPEAGADLAPELRAMLGRMHELAMILRRGGSPGAPWS
jgi:ribonuclease R